MSTAKFDPHKKYRVFVLGDGAWGTALALTLLSKKYQVMLWGYESGYIKKMAKRRENFKFLPGLKLPASLSLTGEDANLEDSYDLMIMAVPTQYCRSILVRVKEYFPPSLPVVSVAKGIENGTLLRPTQVIREILGNRMPLGVLCGPSHAEEVARHIPTSVVASSNDEEFAEWLQHVFNTPRFRVYYNTDLVGVELGGALKNVIAIPAGINDGLKFGDNAKSALMTRGLMEIVRLGVALGARKSTFSGMAGMGDLLTTCFSPHGRNRACGELIGKGKTLKEILDATEKVTEGVWTTKSVLELARKHDIEMPITEELYKILFKNKNIQKAVHDLMTRSSKAEIDKLAE
ncbi:NAD(P)H-dependent glycerol-3-phosphate dehydrogenase [Planctomycetota bacterium]